MLDIQIRRITKFLCVLPHTIDDVINIARSMTTPVLDAKLFD